MAGPRLGAVKVLVLGSGAREHALVKAIAADPEVDAVIAAPGNPGIDATALCVPVDILDGDAVAALAREHEVDLVVVGPEAPLVAGVADVCRAASCAHDQAGHDCGNENVLAARRLLRRRRVAG